MWLLRRVLLPPPDEFELVLIVGLAIGGLAIGGLAIGGLAIGGIATCLERGDGLKLGGAILVLVGKPEAKAPEAENPEADRPDGATEKNPVGDTPTGGLGMVEEPEADGATENPEADRPDEGGPDPGVGRTDEGKAGLVEEPEADRPNEGPEGGGRGGEPEEVKKALGNLKAVGGGGSIVKSIIVTLKIPIASRVPVSGSIFRVEGLTTVERIRRLRGIDSKISKIAFIYPIE